MLAASVGFTQAAGSWREFSAAGTWRPAPGSELPASRCGNEAGEPGPRLSRRLFWAFSPQRRLGQGLGARPGSDVHGGPCRVCGGTILCGEDAPQPRRRPRTWPCSPGPGGPRCLLCLHLPGPGAEWGPRLRWVESREETSPEVELWGGVWWEQRLLGRWKQCSPKLRVRELIVNKWLRVEKQSPEKERCGGFRGRGYIMSVSG